MAYVIGSQKGKDIAKGMKTGETYKASDGSVWTKESDGSVTVTTSGNTYKNAYTPTTSGGSSGGGGSSYSGSSGGSSYSGSSGGSNKNSQYTAPTLGDTWNANTDYQAIINSAVQNGDYVTAAKAEQLRNQKITATGSKYNTTNMYSGHLGNTDYGILGQQLMANNANWQDVQDVLDSRVNKANNTAGLEKYAYDDTFWMMYNYIQDQKNAEIMQGYEDKIAELEQGRPEDYQSKYDPKIDALLNEILNRDDFSYDAMNDPLYQQYADMYRREGDRAMKETMAEAAAGAGGMNTYAITAAQQANSYYNSQLNDKIPELYQLAYDMYLNDKESKVQDLGILQNMDATQYNRYRDTINDFYNDRNFAYGAYQDAVQQGNWQTNFDYNGTLDNRNFNNSEYWKNKEWDYNDMWVNKEWNAQEEEKEYNRNQYDIETAKDEVWKYIELGVLPSADLLEKAGMTEEEANNLIAAVQTNMIGQRAYISSGGGSSSNKKNSSSSNKKNSGSGGGDGSESSGYTGDGGEDEKTNKELYNQAAILGPEIPAALPIHQSVGNFQTIVSACDELLKTKGKSAVLSYLNEVKTTGAIDVPSYTILLNRYK